MIRSLLDKTDLSGESVSQLIRLVDRILPLDSNLAAALYSTIFKERRQIPIQLFSSSHPLLKGARQTVVDSLLETLEILQKDKDEMTILLIVSSFGHEIRKYPAVLLVLEKLFRTTRSEKVCSMVVSILQKYMEPGQFGELARQMLQSDPSCIFLSEMRQYIHAHEQHLLTPYLDENVNLSGRFCIAHRSSYKLQRGFHRWTQSQQELFAQSRKRYIDDDDAPVLRRQFGLTRLSKLTYINPDILLSYTNDSRPIIRDTALRAASRLDSGQGVPTLLEALEDHRARIAVYALKRAFDSMPKSQALQILRNTTRNKITVAKEVFRLIGDLRCDEAFRTLLELEQTDLQVHVRAALFRGLWPYLEEPETWEVFERAAICPDARIAEEVARIPRYGLSKYAGLSFTKVLVLLISHPSAVVRQAGLNNLVIYHGPETETVLIQLLMKLLQSPIEKEITDAAKQLIENYFVVRPELIAEMFEKLLPNRRVLLAVFNVYMFHIQYRSWTSTSKMVLDVLKKDPRTVKLRLKLILQLPWKDRREQFFLLAPELHADALFEAQWSLQSYQYQPVKEIDEMEHDLASSEDEKFRRLGLALLIAQSKRKAGWTKELREKLLRYQEDSSVLVAEAACFVFPPNEDAEDGQLKSDSRWKKTERELVLAYQRRHLQAIGKSKK